MAQPIRFVHCAGFRFDSPEWEGPHSWTEIRNQDLWQTFEQVLSICQNEKVHFLFITGNLFEQEYTSKNTVERVAKALSGLEGITIIIAPGEKDPLVISSVYRLTNWPENVHIITTNINRIAFPSLRAVVYGVAWTSYRPPKVIWNNFIKIKNKDKDLPISFMLLPGGVVPKKKADRERLVSENSIFLHEEQVKSSGLTYLALGDSRRWQGPKQIGDTIWANCGTILARSFRENWSHGVMVGEISEEFTNIEFLRLDQRRYITLSTKWGNLEEIKAEIIALKADRQQDLFRIKIKDTDLTEAPNIALTLKQNLSSEIKYVEIITEKELPPINDNTEHIFPTLEHVFNTEIAKRIADADNSDLQKHWELVERIGKSALNHGRKLILEQPEQEQIDTDKKNNHEFYSLILNIQQTGDERLFISRVWNSLKIAFNKLEGRSQEMEMAKAEYDALRQKLVEQQHRLEEDRFLQIEIKKLRAEIDYLKENIAHLLHTQKRLTVYYQNPDYRELRQMRAELDRLDEICHQKVEELNVYTNDPFIDWSVIDDLRQECLIWAELWEKKDCLETQIKQLEKEINQTQLFLQTSGYESLPQNSRRQLHRAIEVRSKNPIYIDKQAKMERPSRTIGPFKRRIAKLVHFFRLKLYLHKYDMTESDFPDQKQMLHQFNTPIQPDEFLPWLAGWNDYLDKKSNLLKMLVDLDLKKEYLKYIEKKLTVYSDQVKEKLKHWSLAATNLDDALAVIRKVAILIRAKEEIEKERTSLQEVYKLKLGSRDIDQLALDLEPLSDLEREALITDSEREKELNTMRKKLEEKTAQLKATEQNLRRIRSVPADPELENKLEKLKRQITNYEELKSALKDTRKLLDSSLQRWKNKYGQILENKVQEIMKQKYSIQVSKNKADIVASAEQYYNAYRLAIEYFTNSLPE